MYQLVNDTLSYVIFTNPISSTLIDVARKTGYVKPKAQVPVKTIQTMQPLWNLIGNSRYIIRVAGICGASAVILGAYGSHKHYPEVDSGQKDLRKIYETANRFHFIHTLALLGTPLCRYSKLSATFFSMGMLLFCGTCYYRAFSGEHKFSQLAPAGGVCLILGWLVMVI
ncbi:transmembrane protein 256 homolog [Ctenocephalides felis]|uniref:transmembrane protein 256 homolog n=1 Tax=Ctenocephalides felis TaxID=7515 RepID=UPI000E6E4293|nr:transmembrane protein 256 homolog [Ctenocephalides felis]